MKRVMIFVILVFLASRCLQAQNPPTTKNVVDYFMMMPASLWDLNSHDYSDLQKTAMIDEKDIKNGWLKFTGKDTSDMWEGWGEFVLFKKPDKTYMMAVSILSCGPECNQTLKFFELNQKSWKDVTSEVFKPVAAKLLSSKYISLAGNDEFAESPPVIYVLPRYGTEITVVTQEDITGHKFTLATYAYINGKFSLKTQ